MLQPYGFFSANGVTLNQLNDFNAKSAARATVMFLDNGAGLVGAKIYTPGGAGTDNLKLQMRLFFHDIDALVTSLKSGGLAQIRYTPPGDRLADAAMRAGFEISADRISINEIGQERTDFASIKGVGAHLTDETETAKIGN